MSQKLLVDIFDRLLIYLYKIYEYFSYRLCRFYWISYLNKIIKKKNKVIGIDNLSDYYDVKLKKERLKILKQYRNFSLKK